MSVTAVPPPGLAEYSGISSGQSVADRFGGAAARHPDQIALTMDGRRLTYRELFAHAQIRARGLRALGGEPEQPIVIQSGPTLDAVLLALGVLCSGHPIVLLDAQLPGERVEGIIEQLCAYGRRPAVVILDASHAATEQVADAAGIATLGIDGLDLDTAADTIDGAPSAAADSVASIQFTSGSTGLPKGVLHPHAMWLCDTELMRDGFAITPGRRVALGLPISFGAGLNVLIGSLINAAEVVIADPRTVTAAGFLDAVADAGSHTAFMTPSLLRGVLDSDSVGSHRSWQTLRRIVTTGEALPGHLVAAALRVAPELRVTNWVGSSEASAIAYHDVIAGDPIPAGNIVAGTLAPHKSVRIDPDGAIVVSSPYLALGYLDPAADAGRFSQDDTGLRTFRTGDRGTWDGTTLTITGRIDDAVKIRGYLVEPSEVTRALLLDDDVSDAIVVARQGDSGRNELIGYVVPAGHTRTPPTSVLRGRLLDRLPDWMVPAHLVELAELPRTVRGKIDRSALPAPHRQIDPTVGPLEGQIAEICAAALNLDVVGRTENVYAIGADSLTVQRILMRIGEGTGVQLDQAAAAAAPTVAELASAVADQRDRTRRRRSTDQGRNRLAPSTVVLRRAVGGPVFCFTGAGASALAFVPLAAQLAGVSGVGDVYAFQPNGLTNRGLPDWTVAAAARRHLRDLRRIQPVGPYVLVGHSLGGLIALEVARRLRTAGHHVELVTMLDTFVPPRVVSQARRELTDLRVTPADPPFSAAQRWRRRARLPLAGLWPMSPEASTQALEDVGVRVGLLHRPKTYDGPSLLVMGSGNGDDPRMWDDYITCGATDVLRINCDHLSMIRQPHIDQVIAEMVDRVAGWHVDRSAQ